MQDSTVDITTFLELYVDAWNEPDGERRRVAVKRLYADRAIIVTPSQEVDGGEAVLEHIGEVFAEFIGTRNRRFRCAASTAHHRHILLRWELTTPGLSEVATGVNMLLLGQDGCIEADYQFREPEPGAE
jgi:hypothetical protein